jgi:hypothetical protein
MGIHPYGSDSFLRFQLRHKIRVLKEDDQRIIFEGMNSLTKMELREACQERGMRSTGLSKDAYKRSLQQWLDLSVNFNVPVSLLIMSRTFLLQNESEYVVPDDDSTGVAGLAHAMSGLDKDLLNEVILDVATSEERKSDPDVRKIKLEVLSHQNEMIREEQAEREKKKETAEKLDASAHEASLDGSVDKDASLSEQKLSGSPDTVTEKVFDDTGGKPEKRSTVLKEKIETILEIVEGAKSNEDLSAIVQAADLSADEIEAIEQWVSADPVSKEREDLARIKSAMKESDEKEKMEDEVEEETISSENTAGLVVDEGKQAFESADKYAATVVEEAESRAADEADKSTTFSTDHIGTESTQEDRTTETELVANEDETDDSEAEEHEEDFVVARLKKRIENMVDKIEVQLSDAEMKIGDKLHFLDKDMDGILSLEEIAEALQQVLKRKITKEEALELVSDMVGVLVLGFRRHFIYMLTFLCLPSQDTDGDGLLTVQELIKWIDTNKLVRLESEGRDADMERIMESHRSGNQREDNALDDSQSDSSAEMKPKQ